MAIDLIVQHVHSQLEEVGAAWSRGCSWWGRPCPCRGGITGSSAPGAKVGTAWLPSVRQACEPRGCPHGRLPAPLPPIQRRRVPRPCALVSARLLCKLCSGSSWEGIPSPGEQVIWGQTSHPPVIRAMCPRCLPPSRGQHRPEPCHISVLRLRLLLFTPLQTPLHSLSSQEPTFLCLMQPMGFQTQSLVTFDAQPEPRSRQMLPITGFNKSSSASPGPVLTSGLSL